MLQCTVENAPLHIRYFICISSLKVRRLSRSEDIADFQSPRFSGLVTLTFDLSISTRDHCQPVSWASFPPIFNLLRPSILDLGSGTRQIDRR